MGINILSVSFGYYAFTSNNPNTPDSNSPAHTPTPLSPDQTKNQIINNNSINMSDVNNAATIPTEKTVEELKANVEKVVEEVVEEKVAEKRPAENGEDAKVEEPEAKKAKE